MPIREWVLKARWRSTAKSIKVMARNEDEAIEKALRRKDIEGCEDLVLIESNLLIIPPKPITQVEAEAMDKRHPTGHTNDCNVWKGVQQCDPPNESRKCDCGKN